MLSVLRNSHRLSTAARISERSARFWPNPSSSVRCKSENIVVTIADVSKEVRPASNPEYVPRKYLLNTHSQEALRHLKWMLQKDVLRQDMFLMGGPGVRRRELALAFLELTERELEFIALTRDTTEADLKQRREIKSGTAYYHDQSAVRAATNGRVLLIEGVEKAERNVLPVLNNLLENREMHLEDGRFLIPASRYDKLLKMHTQAELDKWRLVRVSEDFIVIALGLPSPRYPGHPLDPPLRSRFQARHIPPPTFEEQFEILRNLTPNVDAGKLSQLLSCAHTLVTQEAVAIGLPDFPLDNLSSAALIMDKSPDLSVYNIFYRFYPYKLFLGKEGQNAVEDILGTFNVLNDSKTKHTVTSKIDAAKRADDFLEISIERDNTKTSFHVSCGTNQLSRANNDYIETNYQNNLLASMMESHLTSDFCLIGPKGCGKSTTVRQLADLLGYQVEPIVLYQDMTSRDLIQQRTTSLNGDTVWRDSPLVDAALYGKLAVLDGINRIHSSILAILHRLVHDRELQLHDGKRLIRADRYDEIKKEYNRSDEEMRDHGVLRIHPAFRLIALAEPPVVNSSSGQWLNSELLSSFLFHEMRPLDKREEIHIIRSKFGEPNQALLSIVELAHVLRSSNDPTLLSLAGSLSTRQLLRIAERMHRFRCDDAYNAVQRACLARFLPAIAKQALGDSCHRLGIVPPKSAADTVIEYSVTEDSVRIGDTAVFRYRTAAPSKVPDIVFYDVPEHVALLERLLQDFSLGQNLLLVGNQGVGKNKIVDRLLQLLNRPREYIQLHRDTTVQTLTLQPMVRDGKVVYEDSPLVQAVKLGHVLVVDEADKAPTHVTCILKTLVESGEMILSDGRRIVPRVNDNARDNNANSIRMHPDFRMIVLANRPGFPFLGNDFFGALGDLFSTHSVDNPSIRSEIQLLKQYGPHIDERTIHKLVGAFGELRGMADQGLVSYPYSTREVVNIIKHLEKFPNEPLGTVVCNVFDFDRYSQEVFDTLVTVLHNHGIPVGTSPNNVASAKKPVNVSALTQWLYAKDLPLYASITSNEGLVTIDAGEEKLQITKERYSGQDVSGPKHGKIDKNNEPHVGGNTWAGGTGGRDTAGLGGKGGPYRLDAGHTVHQLSDEEKNAVPEHIKKAAREMGLRAFRQRLKDIKMSEYDHKLYAQFSDAVHSQVQALRVILGSLQAKSNERQWCRHQTSGELDDTKLIEGLTGEKTIYRRRAEKEPEIGAPQLKPKRLKLVADVSGSMYRFNGYDGRLDRELEACVMVMEAFSGYEGKFQYDIVGHSGDDYHIVFVDRTQPPTDNKRRLEVVKTMHAHSQFCMSGDNTLEATQHAIASLAKEDSDESIVVVLSDANLDRYGISPQRFAKLLTSNADVNAYAIFIGSLGDQAIRLTKKMPSGRAFVCMDLKNIPRILQQIFTASVLSTTRST